MSDEESFVILGSSPMSSLEIDGVEGRTQTLDLSLESDAPGSRFTSLKNSQISDLNSAQEIATQTQNFENQSGDKSTKLPNSFTPLTKCINKSIEMQTSNVIDPEIAANKLWSKPTLQVEIEENIKQLSLADCALKPPIEEQQQLKIQQTSALVTEEKPNNKHPSPSTVNSDLAASFIMGEINSDILKTSVYSQFPSISLEACAEDVVKLQNMVTEYSQLKSMIKKANNTMKLFYQNSLQWKEKLQTMEEDYKQQLNNCKKEIAELNKQNAEMSKNMQTQIEALEIARNQDRAEYIKEISEKSAVLENMRAQIVILEEKQMASSDMARAYEEQQKTGKVYVQQLEHEAKIKDLETQLSELFASNLDLKDVDKQYVDELNCLKVNLTAAEELIAKNSSEIVQLQSKITEKDQQIERLETSFESLQLAFEEQKERIALLEAQNEVHRTDFEMEKQSRETAIKEKQQMLQDLRALQKKNQELIEEQQKLAESYQKRISAAASNDAQINAASAASETYFNNPQRRIRIVAAPSAPAPPSPVSLNVCPICNKGFKSLNILLSHVDDCVDKN